MKPRIVVVGSANTDMVVRVDTIPRLGETVLGEEFTSVQGGKGANQAVAAARLGAEVTFVARLGRDTFGEASATAYRSDGINIDYIVWDDAAPTGVALIMVNRKGENIITVAQGANRRLSPEDVNAAEDAFRAADAVLLQLEIPTEAVQTAIQLARKYHSIVILNPAPAIPLPYTILQHIDYLTPNETELALLAGSSPGPVPAVARTFATKVGLKGLIVTMGAEGAQVITGQTEYTVPGYKVKAIDTVAAGDAFNGALAVAISRGENLLAAVQFANAVGALSVMRAGAQPSLPTLEEVTRFLDDVNRMNL